jgi:molybdopterin-guanine dinucleotide biosynthesis protein A
MNVGGIILCGGRSRRMGRPKAELPFGAETMLARIVRILGEVVEPVVVVAAPGQEIAEAPLRVQMVRDEAEGRGPLQGFAAGLAALPPSCAAAFASSCDVPFLQPGFVRRMIELLKDAQVAVPEVDGQRHALAGVYRTSVAAAARQLLDANRLRFSQILEIVDTRLILPSELTDVDPELLSLWNVNTPEDYAAALRRLQAGSV